MWMMPKRSTKCGVARLLMVVLAAGATSAAQVTSSDETPQYQPIDQAVADYNELSTSLRVIEPGLEQPSQFDSVYRIEDGRYTRVNGALHAVFPNSVYKLYKKGRRSLGLLPVVPANTTFFIGPPPTFEENDPVAPGQIRSAIGAGLRIDPRVTTQVDATSAGPLGPTPPTAPRSVVHRRPPRVASVATIATDPVYRARRIRALLDRAASASDRAVAEVVTDGE